ncbi:hypothetical protein F2Q68_00016242 [Brassica cretica]|uniref:Uncharacterized protein n=1 Tax=Brassica cretica TaxID=69181 RepID=A0A8S9HR74_BRACR|nr:hypothetical protein F2Q68_00016242 [Brassica cretica]
MPSKLKRKSHAAESTHQSGSDLRAVINKSRAKRVESNSIRPRLKPRVLDLRDHLNSTSEDLRIRLNRPKNKEEDAKVCNSQEHPAGLQSQSSDPIGTCDLRSKLKRKSHAAESTHQSGSDLRAVINKSRAKRVESNSIRPRLKPRVLDLRDHLNSTSEDLRIRLNRPKSSDLRRKFEEKKAKSLKTKPVFDRGKQKPIFYTSKRMTDPETARICLASPAFSFLTIISGDIFNCSASPRPYLICTYPLQYSFASLRRKMFGILLLQIITQRLFNPSESRSFVGPLQCTKLY